MEQRVSLKDIAERAGVHATTVSMALRNHPRLPERTRTRIKKIATEMGYTRDPALSALVQYRNEAFRRRNPPVIAYVTDWSDLTGWKKALCHPDFHEGARMRAEELGYKLEHFSLRESGMTPARMSKILQTRGIRGVILSSFEHPVERLELDWDQFVAVKIDLQPVWPPLHVITNNHLQIMRSGWERVREFGYRKPGAVYGDDWSSHVKELWDVGYAWEESKLPRDCRVPPFLFGSGVGASRRHRFPAWFEKYRPDVLLGPNREVMEQVEEMGLRVPDDVAVADIFLERRDAFFAGIVHNSLEVGAKAVEILSGMVINNQSGIPGIPIRTDINGTWFDGPSCPDQSVGATRAGKRGYS
jgi:LacI family transcriptional regulator